MNYLIGIDVGTSGVKSSLFDTNGRVIASATEEYPLYQPQNGWAEQNPLDWWEKTVDSLHKILKNSGIAASAISGIGISGQMHGLVMLDKKGEVLRNAIIWCDGRTSKECEEITRRVGAQKLIDISANPALTGFTASKILWVRNNEPELYEQCAHILLPKDYIRYRLTNDYATDVSDASGMNLMDIPKRCWSSEILSALDIDRALLADLYESCEVTGYVSSEAAHLTGLAQGTVVVGGAGDNAAAAIGVGVVKAGRAFTTIGTSGVIFAHTDSVSIDQKGRVHTFCSAVPGAWTVMSCTLSAGFSLKWFRDNFCTAETETALGMAVDPYYLMDKQVARIPVGSNRLLYLPYLMGERSPLLDPHARGVFFGLSGIHTKYDMIRAVMEGVSFSQRDCLDILKQMGVKFEEMLICGGGGNSPLWRQMLADVYGCPVTTVVSKEGGTLGAAILAGVGAGIYATIEEACSKMIQLNPMQQPDQAAGTEYEKYYAIYKQLYPLLKEQFYQLAAIDQE